MTVRSLAAYWCSVLACDRATAAWLLKLVEPQRSPYPALRLAWQVWQRASLDSPRDTAAERWARAEAMLRCGWRR